MTVMCASYDGDKILSISLKYINWTATFNVINEHLGVQDNDGREKAQTTKTAWELRI